MSRWRRRRAQRKIKPGDGHQLKPFRPWWGLWRSRFSIELTDEADQAYGADAVRHEYILDLDFFDLDEKVHLYRDGVHTAVATMPIDFPVPGGRIEAATSTYGMRRAHHVADDGTERQLRPVPGTAEHWRARMGQRFPRFSRWLAATAIVVLLISLALLAPQLLEQVTHIDWVAEHVGSFTSPIALPAWTAPVLLVAGILAGAERALTLRNHWLIDADTWFLGD